MANNDESFKNMETLAAGLRKPGEVGFELDPEYAKMSKRERKRYVKKVHKELDRELAGKRNEIRDLMRDPTYDSACALRQLLDRERRKRDEASRHIAALEYLCRVGLDAALHSVLRQMTLDELGQALLQSDPPQAPDAVPPDADVPEKTPLTL